MKRVREPAVAALFYPGDRKTLESEVRALLDAARSDEPAPKAMIVPHAGYVYSGAVAASAYGRRFGAIERVVLLGPAHRHAFRGVATHSADWFATPLGRIRIERTDLAVLDSAHVGEHSLEVHLPFLQVLFGDFALVPIVVGDATPDEVAAAIEPLWGGDETLIVISSDLSHFHDYDTARRIDAATAEAITRLEPVQPEQACGCRAIGGLQVLARRKGLSLESIDLRNSGDTAGSRDSVVGYGAFVTGRRPASSCL